MNSRGKSVGAGAIGAVSAAGRARNVYRVILSSSQTLGPVFLVLAYSLFVFSIKPRFLSPQNLANVAQQIVPVGLIALGQTFVLVSGGIDLSTGGIIALSSVTMGVVFGLTNNIAVAILAALAFALCIGIINALLIAKVKLPAMIVTLSTMSICTGLVLIVMGVMKRVFFISHPLLYFLGGDRIYGIPYCFILLIFIFLLGYLLYNHTKLGIYTRAIGGSEQSTRFAGVSIDKYKMEIYMLSSLLAGLGGVFITSRMAIVQPITGGAATMLLESIAAVIIGGTSLQGGKGTIQGTFIGVVLIGLIGNSLNVLNINPYLQDVFRGLVFIGILIFDRIVNRGA